MMLHKEFIKEDVTKSLSNFYVAKRSGIDSFWANKRSNSSEETYIWVMNIEIIKAYHIMHATTFQWKTHTISSPILFSTLFTAHRFQKACKTRQRKGVEGLVQHSWKQPASSVGDWMGRKQFPLSSDSVTKSGSSFFFPKVTVIFFKHTDFSFFCHRHKLQIKRNWLLVSRRAFNVN